MGVFTIPGYLGDRVFCLALVLMEQRDIASYRRVFSKIRKKINLFGQNWAPTNSVVYFEIGKFSHVVYL